MKNLFKSLANFQQEVPTILKATKGFGYNYADLPAIFDIINPLLKKHGLGFTQLIDNKDLTTILFHVESGETLESKTNIPQVVLKGMNDYQAFGSGITYYRRYTLASMLGLVTDKDTDAGGEQKPVKNELPTLTNERFEKALVAIEQGQTTKEKIMKDFKLTPNQIEKL